MSRKYAQRDFGYAAEVNPQGLGPRVTLYYRGALGGRNFVDQRPDEVRKLADAAEEWAKTLRQLADEAEGVASDPMAMIDAEFEPGDVVEVSGRWKALDELKRQNADFWRPVYRGAQGTVVGRKNDVVHVRFDTDPRPDHYFSVAAAYLNRVGAAEAEVYKHPRAL